MQQLYYQTPPAEWMEGLPIGNGRLACMVWGDHSDRFTLNHEWLWTGRNGDRHAECTADGLPLVRKFIREGNHYMATVLANALFGGKGGMTGLPGRVDDYQPAGELRMTFPGNSEFKERKLDITTGVAEICRTCGDSCVHTEIFTDCNDGCFRIRWDGDFPFSGTLSMNREAETGTTLKYSSGSDFLRLDGAIKNGICFAVMVRLQTDGEVRPFDDSVEIQNATNVSCIVNIATDRQNLEAELSGFPMEFSSYEKIRDAHIQKFSSLMKRIDFELEDKEPHPLPTDVRIKNVKDGKTDNGISKLYFDFGRYLLISSSVCGQLPANLQGKWNDSLTPPWNCDYHFDINLEMNYWLAEPAGLFECAETLIRYVRSFIPSGKETARNLYGCRGICLPIQTDAWGNATPESMGWAAWIGAAPWIARHLWDHYRYTGDQAYLRDQAYEFFKLVAEFYEDYLQKDEDGVYQILPSQSPENTIAATGNFPVLITQSAAMDVQLCYDSLGYAIESAKILKIDEDRVEVWKELQENLPPFAIGHDGRLLEWQEEYEEKEPGHRHLSHLYGLYPSDLFAPYKRPAQYRAAVRSYQYRLSHGGGHTGWSRAWSACIAARIGDAESFYHHFITMIRSFATSSLLDLHPPHIFQIEGNFGAVAAVIESLVGWYDDAAHLMHSIPEQWNTGHLYGVKIPGGHTLCISWKNYKPQNITITFGYSGNAMIEWDGMTHCVQGKPGETIRLL